MDEEDKLTEICHHPHFHHEITSLYFNSKSLGIKQLLFVLKLSCVDCGRPYTFRADDGFSTEVPTSHLPGQLVIPVVMPPKMDRPDDEDVEIPSLH